MAGVEEVAVREGRIASTASQRGDTRHEKRPHGWRTGHDAGADVKHTDVVFGVFVRGSHARESDDREETGQASWLEVFGVERGRRGTSRGGARACKGGQAAATDGVIPHMEDMSGDVGVGEVNRRPGRRDEGQAHPIEGELEPAARGRQARGARRGITPPKGRFQAGRVQVQEVGDGGEEWRQAIRISVRKIAGL